MDELTDAVFSRGVIIRQTHTGVCAECVLGWPESPAGVESSTVSRIMDTMPYCSRDRAADLTHALSAQHTHTMTSYSPEHTHSLSRLLLQDTATHPGQGGHVQNAGSHFIVDQALPDVSLYIRYTLNIYISGLYSTCI